MTEIPVPENYTLGPGEKVKVQLWGNQSQQLSLTMSRERTIEMPERGPISVAGMTFQQVKEEISRLVAEQYICVKAAVSLGELRSMRVFLLGEARTPRVRSV